MLDADARLLVVGAHALAVHGQPRATQDIDVWIDAMPAHSARVWQAVLTFGAPVEALGVMQQDLQQGGASSIHARANAMKSVAIGAPPEARTSNATCPRWYIEWCVRWSRISDSAVSKVRPLVFV